MLGRAHNSQQVHVSLKRQMPKSCWKLPSSLCSLSSSIPRQKPKLFCTRWMATYQRPPTILESRQLNSLKLAN